MARKLAVVLVAALATLMTAAAAKGEASTAEDAHGRASRARVVRTRVTSASATRIEDAAPGDTICDLPGHVCRRAGNARHLRADHSQGPDASRGRSRPGHDRAEVGRRKADRRRQPGPARRPRRDHRRDRRQEQPGHGEHLGRHGRRERRRRDRGHRLHRRQMARSPARTSPGSSSTRARTATRSRAASATGRSASGSQTSRASSRTQATGRRFAPRTLTIDHYTRRSLQLGRRPDRRRDRRLLPDPELRRSPPPAFRTAAS